LQPSLVEEARRIAVEFDGGQHLSDPVAYRRDRRKDQLLQENGYLVLRFLAEDVGRNLDLVLDTILRALVHRQETLSVGSPLVFFPSWGNGHTK
jgi:very-short-patch-repair endonuclease